MAAGEAGDKRGTVPTRGTVSGAFGANSAPVRPAVSAPPVRQVGNGEKDGRPLPMSVSEPNPRMRAQYDAYMRGGPGALSGHIGSLFLQRMAHLLPEIVGYDVTKTFASDALDPVVTKKPIFAPQPEQLSPQGPFGSRTAQNRFAWGQY